MATAEADMHVTSKLYRLASEEGVVQVLDLGGNVLAELRGPSGAAIFNRFCHLRTFAGFRADDFVSGLLSGVNYREEK